MGSLTVSVENISEIIFKNQCEDMSGQQEKSKDDIPFNKAESVILSIKGPI